MTHDTPPTASRSPSALHTRDLAAIFLVSAAVMLYQIALTRVLSVVVWYHFAFLTISMVMLGLGVPGVWLSFAKHPKRMLQPALLASGIFLPASVALLVQFGAATLSTSVAYLVAFVLPAMLALGTVVCVLLMRAEGPEVGRMYGVDLLGACVGAVLIIPLMHTVPTPALGAATGLLPLVALLLYPGRLRIAGAAVAVGVAGMIGGTDLLHITKSKDYDESQVPPIFEKWSPTARITIFDEAFFMVANDKTGFSWGRGSVEPPDEAPRQYWLEQDGSAGTPITEFTGDLTKVQHLQYDVTTLGYQLRPPKRAAIIGAGGGRDILSALLAGAQDIDAVELNEHTIRAVSERYRDVSGGIYDQPGVHAVANEGRSHLTHAEGGFDLIQVSLIDSWAASAAGAFALAENNLYTVEAFELYLDKLSEHGILSMSRWMTEMPRLVILARASLEAVGVEHPEDHLMLGQASEIGTLLIAREPFTAADKARLHEVGAERGFTVMHPLADGQTAPDPFLQELIEGDYTRMEALGLNLEPPRDDSPYFFHVLSPFRAPSSLSKEALAATGLSFNLQSSMVLRQAMLSVGGLAILLFLAPFGVALIQRRPGDEVVALARGTTYFAAIGAGFMLFENMLVQRFVLYLGHPSYATTVIIASLLAGMGAGSFASERVGLTRFQRWGLGVAVLLMLVTTVLPPLFRITLGSPLALRILISATLLVPLGALLGLFFPLGFGRFGDGNKPWFWAINGVFGVVASVMSLSLSMEFGYAVVGWISASIYLLAWLLVRPRQA